jgi:fatty acid desaturase
MAKPPPQADAEFTRALIRAMVIEAVFAAIGVVGILMTHQWWALVVPVAMGGILFLALFLPAQKAWRARQADTGGQSPIVQDGGV